MRQLTAALEAAQKQETSIPCIKVRAVNKAGGVVMLNWSRLYSGAETEYFHALAVPADGSLVRVRLTPSSDSRRLYRQRVVNPGPESDFSSWIYTGQTDVLAVAAASHGAEVSIVFIKGNREVRRLKSADYGATWGSPELLDYTATDSVYGAAAAYKPNGDLAIFFADQAAVYVKKCVGGQWQSKAAWDKSAGMLSGISCIYDNDWCLLLTGKDTAGNYKLWSFVLGDGGDIAAGVWSALREIAAAPAGGEFSYKQPYLDKTDVCRCYFVEAFTGIEACSRPFRSYVVPGTRYCDGSWREPAPVNIPSEYGLAMAHYGAYSWFSSPSGVWRAAADIQILDLTEDVVKVRQELGKTGGTLVVELRNDDGRYALPGQGGLAPLAKGFRLEFSPGYMTAGGSQYSEGQSYTIDSVEHTRSGGRAALVIHAGDGWGPLEKWRARFQFRWNKTGPVFSVKDILTVILARVGLTLNIISQSAAATGYCPDFTVNPGNNGKDTVKKLLGFIPDEIFIEGDTAWLINPQSGDSAVYSYGSGHPVLESLYRREPMAVNRVQAEGWDNAAGRVIIVDRYAWDEIETLDDRFRHIADRNIGTVAEAEQRGDALLRQAEMEAETGSITIPVNCGHQLFDVVTVTDTAAGLSSSARRVSGITLVYNPSRGEYFQRLGLGKV